LGRQHRGRKQQRGPRGRRSREETAREVRDRRSTTPLILSLSKDEPLCSWFDKLTTSGRDERDARVRRARFNHRLITRATRIRPHFSVTRKAVTL
jgi:hypothetical protein